MKKPVAPGPAFYIHPSYFILQSEPLVGLAPTNTGLRNPPCSS